MNGQMAQRPGSPSEYAVGYDFGAKETALAILYPPLAERSSIHWAAASVVVLRNHAQDRSPWLQERLKLAKSHASATKKKQCNLSEASEWFWISRCCSQLCNSSQPGLHRARSAAKAHLNCCQITKIADSLLQGQPPELRTQIGLQHCLSNQATPKPATQKPVCCTEPPEFQSSHLPGPSSTLCLRLRIEAERAEELFA